MTVIVILLIVLIGFIVLVKAGVKGLEYEEEQKRARRKKQGEYRQRERYRQYLQSDAWELKRRKVLKRDKHKCVYCGARATQVHHTQYKDRRGTEPMKWLESICSDCHRELHGGSKEDWDMFLDIAKSEKINRKLHDDRDPSTGSG